MMRRGRRGGRVMRSRASRDRGAVIVETALIAPVLMLLMVGAAEFGIAWRASNVASSTVRAAVLEESRTGDDRLLDLHMIERVRATLDDLDTIEWVMVYRVAAADTGDPPAGCLTIADALSSGSDGVDGVCTVFHGTFVATASEADFTDPNCTGEADEYLCPAIRESIFVDDDRIGVAISIDHDWLTGLPPRDGIIIQDHSVAYRLPGLEALP